MTIYVQQYIQQRAMCAEIVLYFGKEDPKIFAYQTRTNKCKSFKDFCSSSNKYPIIVHYLNAKSKTVLLNPRVECFARRYFVNVTLYARRMSTVCCLCVKNAVTFFHEQTLFCIVAKRVRMISSIRLWLLGMNNRYGKKSRSKQVSVLFEFLFLTGN